MKSLFYKIINFFSYQREKLSGRLFYHCDLCLQPSQKYSLLCDTCHHDLVKVNLLDYHGNLINHPKVSKLLGAVRFQHLISLAPYCWPYNQWISQLKYQHRFEIGPLLGQIFAQHLIVSKSISGLPEMIIPVPLHGLRLRARQYNQSWLIGKALARYLHIECVSGLVTRVRKTKTQVGQSGVSRRKNLRGAFAVSQGAIFPEHVAIIDDVITTGTTVNEMSKLLLQHGVKKITVLTVCLVINN